LEKWPKKIFSQSGRGELKRERLEEMGFVMGKISTSYGHHYREKGEEKDGLERGNKKEKDKKGVITKKSQKKKGEATPGK